MGSDQGESSLFTFWMTEWLFITYSLCFTQPQGEQTVIKDLNHIQKWVEAQGRFSPKMYFFIFIKICLQTNMQPNPLSYSVYQKHCCFIRIKKPSNEPNDVSHKKGGAVLALLTRGTHTSVCSTVLSMALPERPRLPLLYGYCGYSELWGFL